MQGLEYFITVLIPTTIFMIIVFAIFTHFVAITYNKFIRSRFEKLEDMMDAYYYEVKRNKVKQNDCGKKYATINDAVEIFKRFQETICQSITLKNQMKQFVKSSEQPFLLTRAESLNSPRIYHPDSTHIGPEEAETTIRSMS